MDADSTHATLADYYDGDYPSIGVSPACNWDEASLRCGVTRDVAWYARRARSSGRALDVGAGTGRLSRALATIGVETTAVEPSAAMRARLAENLDALDTNERRRVVVRSSLDELRARERFDVVTLMFGVLSCVTTLDEQIALLIRLRKRLVPGGSLLLDVQNPLAFQASIARPSWIRVHPTRGARFTRVAGATAIDSGQRLRLYGTYEEDRRAPSSFSILQRCVYPGELELMLRAAGFARIEAASDVHGGPISTNGRIFVVARAKGGDDDSETWLPRAPEGVGVTALATAAARATHLQRSSDPVVVDPFALRLSGQAGIDLMGELGDDVGLSSIARSRWFDERIEEAVASGTRTLVSIGAGLCTRALRMKALQGVDVIELDHAALLAFKEAMLSDVNPARLPARHAVDLSMAGVAPRLSAILANARRPVAIVAEGLFNYLDPAQGAALLEAMTELGDFVFVDLSEGQGVTPTMRRSLDRRGIAWHPPPPLPRSPRHRLSTTHLGAPDASFGLVRSDDAPTKLHAFRPRA